MALDETGTAGDFTDEETGSEPENAAEGVLPKRSAGGAGNVGDEGRAPDEGMKAAPVCAFLEGVRASSSQTSMCVRPVIRNYPSVA